MQFRPGARRVRIRLGIAVTVMSAAGCAPAPNSAHHTVEGYLKNPDLRRAALVRCANDPGRLGSTADCVNARKAEGIAGLGSLRDLPPLKLPPGK